MMFVLDFLKKEEMEKFFDNKSKKIIDYLLKKVLFSQPELLPEQEETYIQMTKEFLEMWIAQAFKMKTVGAGNYPIDVYDENKKIGFDIKFISGKVDENGDFTKTISNESSLAQNFAEEGNNLDLLFNNGNYKEILNNWKKLLKNKFDKAKMDLNLKDIFYFIFIRGKNSIFLSISKVKFKNIDNLEIDRANNKSVFVKNYLKNEIGQVKIYKSKKRMEIRVYPKYLKENNLFLEWNFNDKYKQKKILLRDIIEEQDEFKKYLKKEFDNLFN